MVTEVQALSENDPPERAVELPRPTVAPLVLALGVTLAAAGVALSVVFLIVGAALFVAGLALWIGELLPGRGHLHVPVEAHERPGAVAARMGRVEQLQRGMPGYRLRLPERVHPISAGIKGGLVGGLVMPLPALLYGLISGHGIWLPVNLLAGMVLPGVDAMSLEELEQFWPGLLLLGIGIHVTVALVFGLLYGVLLPTLPTIGKPLAWGGLLMPLLWTAASYLLASAVNPSVRERIDWPWFVASQFVFGIVAALAVMRSSRRNPVALGLLAGIVAGALMSLPAMCWGYLSGHGVWYPINLLAGMILPGVGDLPMDELQAYRPDWLAAAAGLHAVLSLAFGLSYTLVLPRLPAIPGAFAWGGLLMPLLWTATSYGLMGVVNPVLQQRVDWAWFVVSQFVFGIAAAIVVVCSQQIHIPPAGRGAEPLDEYLAG